MKYHLIKSKSPNLQVHPAWCVLYYMRNKTLLLGTSLYKLYCSEANLQIWPAVSHDKFLKIYVMNSPIPVSQGCWCWWTKVRQKPGEDTALDTAVSHSAVWNCVTQSDTVQCEITSQTKSLRWHGSMSSHKVLNNGDGRSATDGIDGQGYNSSSTIIKNPPCLTINLKWIFFYAIRGHTFFLSSN